MKTRSLLFMLGGLLLALPLLASAHMVKGAPEILVPATVQTAAAASAPGSNGLVGCNGAATCGLCAFTSLFQSIINFLIGLTVPLSALLFAWAGILYFTSGASSSQTEKAKKIFTSVAIGLVIAMGGWLGVQTLLKTVLAPGYYQSWNNINCTQTSRPMNGTVGSWLSSVLPGLNTNAPAGNTLTTGGSAYACQSGTLASDGYCYNSDNQLLGAPQLVQTAAGTMSCAQYGADNSGIYMAGGQCYSGETNTLLGPASATPSAANGGIAAAAAAYYGTDTSSGPDGGNKACAWAVNNILQSDGIAPIDGDSVYNMQQALNSGRGTPVDPASAQAGDIVIFGGMSHVGICYDPTGGTGCPQVLSNSSSQASFTSIYPPTSGSSFYRVN